jgi:hypothetical protein
MTSQVEIARFTEAQNKKYTLRAALSAEISACENRVKTLKKERKELDAFLAPVFGHDDEKPEDAAPEYRRWKKIDPKGKSEIVILERKLIIVSDTIAEDDIPKGTVLSKGYSYAKYSIVADE